MSYVSFQNKRARQRKAAVQARAVQVTAMLQPPQPQRSTMPYHGVQDGDTWVEASQGVTYFCSRINGQTIRNVCTMSGTQIMIT